MGQVGRPRKYPICTICKRYKQDNTRTYIIVGKHTEYTKKETRNGLPDYTTKSYYRAYDENGNLLKFYDVRQMGRAVGQISYPEKNWLVRLVQSNQIDEFKKEFNRLTNNKDEATS